MRSWDELLVQQVINRETLTLTTFVLQFPLIWQKMRQYAERVREGMLFYCPNFPSTFPQSLMIRIKVQVAHQQIFSFASKSRQSPHEEIWFCAAVIGAAFTRRAHEQEAIKQTHARSLERVSLQSEIDQSPINAQRTRPGGEQLLELLGCCSADFSAQPRVVRRGGER